MDIDIPPAVSFTRPLLTKFKELYSLEPIVAYFCLILTVKQVLESKIHTTDASVAEFATNIMNKAEEMKSDTEILNNEKCSEILATDEASKDYVMAFANNIFDQAELATLTQKVTKATAAKFAASASFLGLEAAWEPLTQETSEKIKFAKFQATRILRAIKAGDDPNQLYEINEPEELEDNSVVLPEDDGNIGLNLPEIPNKEPVEGPLSLPKAPQDDPEGIDLPAAPEAPLNDQSGSSSPETSPSPVEKPTSPSVDPPKPVAPRSPPAPVVPPPPPKENLTKKVSEPVKTPSKQTPAQLMELTKSTGVAQKHAKYAISALNYDDIPTAIAELEKALNVLKQTQ